MVSKTQETRETLDLERARRIADINDKKLFRFAVHIGATYL